MEGIQYLVTESGKKKSVVIDLEMLGDVWEDFFDTFVANERENEERIDFDSIKSKFEDENL